VTHETDKAACGRVLGRLDELLDGALPALERARDEGHLEACADCWAVCSERSDRQAQLRWALAPTDGELERATAGLEQRLAVARAPATQPQRRVGVLGAAALALTALVALAAIEGLCGVDVAGELLEARRAVSSALPAATWPEDLGRVVGEE
jgi:anti-sigma factor RsiW